ncbi:MAG: hypothetical protein KGL29_01830 [Alphaproteobacteria bacterium]|nr:hypothetical protein [Alphaproteobacteria bacterium]MDE2264613.1 hypothetical protein [Alphaproteobacteria bacterium]
MKLLRFLVPLAALTLAPVAAPAALVGSSAQGGPQSGTTQGVQGGMTARGLDTIPRTNFVKFRQVMEKQRALYALREEGLRLQAADGGRLTPQHLAYLQAKLDAIQGRTE